LNLLAAFRELEHLYIPIKQIFVRYFPFAPDGIFQTTLARLSLSKEKLTFGINFINISSWFCLLTL